MTRLSKFGLVAISVALLVLISRPSVHAGDPDPGSQKFSRSAWIARNMDRVPFSGGVIPASVRLPGADRSLRPLAKVNAKKTRLPRRVNRDLLDTADHPQPGTQAEPYIHANPENPKHLVAGWQENRFPDGGAQSLNVAVSFNAGKTWAESLLPGLTLASGGRWERASDPWVEFGPDGTVYFVSLLFNETDPDNAIGVSRSPDGGLTWESPVEIARTLVDFNDKEALTVDTSAASPYRGRVYVAWDINETSSQQVRGQRLVLVRSRDNGTYRPPKTIRFSNVNIGAVPRVGPDGTVYLIWSGDRPGSNILDLYFSRSTNGGGRWSRPRVIGELTNVGVTDIRSGVILPSFNIDPRTGDLYVAWQDARWTGTDQTTLMWSRDRGATWSEPMRVSAAPDDAPTFTGSVAVNALGQVAVSYFSLENDPSRSFLTDHFVRISKDGGRTFGRPIRATRRTFDIRSAAQARGYFLGDYMGLTGAGEQFHLLWVDTHRSSASLGGTQPDVWASRTR